MGWTVRNLLPLLQDLGRSPSTFHSQWIFFAVQIQSVPKHGLWIFGFSNVKQTMRKLTGMSSVVSLKVVSCFWKFHLGSVDSAPVSAFFILSSSFIPFSYCFLFQSLISFFGFLFFSFSFFFFRSLPPFHFSLSLPSFSY